MLFGSSLVFVELASWFFRFHNSSDTLACLKFGTWVNYSLLDRIENRRRCLRTYQLRVAVVISTVFKMAVLRHL